MKGKIIAILIFVLMWISLAGQYLNDPGYTLNPFVLGFARLSGMTLAMMIAPVLYRVIKKPPHKGAIFCMWNSIAVVLVWLCSYIVLTGGIYDETFEMLGGNAVYGLAFYFTNTRLLFPKGKAGTAVIQAANYQTHVNYCPKCGKRISEGAGFCGYCGVKLYK